MPELFSLPWKPVRMETHSSPCPAGWHEGALLGRTRKPEGESLGWGQESLPSDGQVTMPGPVLWGQ